MLYNQPIILGIDYSISNLKEIKSKTDLSDGGILKHKLKSKTDDSEGK